MSSLFPLLPQLLDKDQVNSFYRWNHSVVPFLGSLLPSSAGFPRLLWHGEFLYCTEGLVSVVILWEVVG